MTIELRNETEEDTMETARQIAARKGYTVNEHGIITDPGKFESEPVDALYWWEAVLDGEGIDEYDQDGEIIATVLEVTAEGRAACEHACDATRVVLTESDYGSINIRYYAR